MLPLEQPWPPEFAARYRAAGYWRGETFCGFLAERVRAHPDRIAVVDGALTEAGAVQRLTYAQLWHRALAYAAAYRTRGLGPGQRVIVQLGNTIHFLPAVFGLFRAGLVPVYALPAHRQTELAHFARRAEASAYLHGAPADGVDYAALGAAVQAEVPMLAQLLDVRELGGGPALDDSPMGEADAASSESASSESAPSAVAFLQISGGSTGLSKLIPRTHDDYIYSFRASAEICALHAGSVYMATLPVSHNFPMSSPGVFGALYAGARVVMCPSPQPAVAFPLIERERVTLTGLVPPLALLWMQARAQADGKLATHDLSSLEILQVGGAKLMPEVARRVQPALGCRLQQVFGMAEGLVNYTRLDDPPELVHETQGRPISPDDEILILDDAGQPVAPGEPGHLHTRGPYTIRAYHNELQANARSFTADGYYRTGDIVRRLATGHLVVQGRATDHINRAGEKISAEEIEDHLLAHPQVFDAAVVSLPDPYLGERSCAFLILTPGSGAPPKPVQIKAWMRTRGLAEFKVPDQVVFVEEFATTAVGKISRKELRARLRATLL